MAKKSKISAISGVARLQVWVLSDEFDCSKQKVPYYETSHPDERSEEGTRYQLGLSKIWNPAHSVERNEELAFKQVN